MGATYRADNTVLDRANYPPPPLFGFSATANVYPTWADRLAVRCSRGIIPTRSVRRCPKGTSCVTYPVWAFAELPRSLPTLALALLSIKTP